MTLLRDVPADGAPPDGAFAPAVVEAAARAASWVVEPVNSALRRGTGGEALAECFAERGEVGRGVVKGVEDRAAEFGFEVVDFGVRRYAPSDGSGGLDRCVRARVGERSDEMVGVGRGDLQPQRVSMWVSVSWSSGRVLWIAPSLVSSSGITHTSYAYS